MLKPLLVSFMAVLAVAGAGCGKSSSKDQPGATGGGSATAGAAAAPSGDAALKAKLGAGIECLNRHSGRVFEARNYYVKDIDPDKGPEPGKEYTLLGLYPVEQCATKLREARAWPPAGPALDQAALAALAALEALVPIYEAQAGYYKKGEFRTDEGKKGLATHAQLLTAFKAFGDANRAYSELIGAENRKSRLAEVAAREQKEGRKIGVILDLLMLEAETVIESVPSDPAALDAAALEPKVEAYAKLVDEFAAYASAHADEAKAYGSLGNLIQYSQGFLGKARAVVATLKAKAEPSGDELKRLSDEFNSLVDNYNRS